MGLDLGLDLDLDWVVVEMSLQIADYSFMIYYIATGKS